MSVGAPLESRMGASALAPKVGAPSATPAQLPPRATSTPESRSPFAELLRGLGHEVARGEAVMRGALGAPAAGGTLDAAQLIALQAGVYRYSEAVDLAARMVDHATTALKTVLQGQ